MPVIPFPQWLRCTACNRLAPTGLLVNWGFVNDKPRRPDEAKFFHQDCPRRKRQPLAVAARFVLACVNGHLDDFPYREFVHRGGACPEASHPALQMDDYGGNRGANVMIRCTRCPAKRNISQAMGRRGEESLPMCRGRHPHLGTFETCEPKADGDRRRRIQHVVRADPVHARRAADRGERAAGQGRRSCGTSCRTCSSREILDAFWALPQFQVLHKWGKDEVFDAIEQHAKAADGRSDDQQTEYPDLLHARVGHLHRHAAARADRRLRAAPRPGGVPGRAGRVPLRRRAGRTAPRGPRPDRVHPAGRARPARTPTWSTRAPLARDRPTWVPASEVRGEGIFLRVDESALSAWEAQVARLGRGPRAPGSVRAVPHKPVLRPASKPTSMPCTAGRAPGTSRCTPCATC